MAFRKAIGAVKDQTSIGIAKVSAKVSADIEVAVVKATSHHKDPAREKHARRILLLTSYSPGHVSACVASVSRRLGKTHDWIVALKGLVLVHRLLLDGGPRFQIEIMYATRKGTRMLNMSGFKDEAHSDSWDHSAFVRAYGLYLDQKLELMAFERKLSGSGEIDRFGSRKNGQDGKNELTPLRDMKLERIFGKMNHSQRLLDRFLSCKPMGTAKDNRIVLATLYSVVGESFKVYSELCEVLAVILDRFFDMEYSDCVRSLDYYMNAAKLIDELIGFYSWCKEIGLARSSEFPEVQRITSKLLETLDEFVRDREKFGREPEPKIDEPVPKQAEEKAQEPDEIKALPPPGDYTPQPSPEPEPKPHQKIGDLMDLREESLTKGHGENSLALALFSGSGNESWDPFSLHGGQEITSAWQNPAAEPCLAGWELALVESASNLSKQRGALGGGLDSLLLNGIYDQGIVSQHARAAQFSMGSASSVAMPLNGNGGTQILALPAPDGNMKSFGEDPFAASLSVPPPSYVQMADMENKQELLVQEQVVWQQYAHNGMRGQTSLAKLAVGGYYGPSVQATMPYTTSMINSIGLHPAEYYHNARY